MLDYDLALRAKIDLPKSDSKTLIRCIAEAIDAFEVDNKLLNRLDAGTVSMKDYHAILIQLFYQVWNGASSLALAGSMIGTNCQVAKDYLIHHAEEEKSHWSWILSDLKQTGYTGPDPRVIHPHFSTVAYYSYAMTLGFRFPIGRLCMAAVLEGVSGKFGTKYGPIMARKLQLKADQLQFFRSHGELDQGHSKDIEEIFSETKISEHEYWQLCGVASNTSALYKEIYNSI